MVLEMFWRLARASPKECFRNAPTLRPTTCNMTRELTVMKLATPLALSAVVAGSLALSTANAQTFSTTLGDFKDNAITVDIFTFTYVDALADVNDPAPPGAFPSVGPTNLPDDAEVDVTVTETGTPCCTVANFAVSNLGQLTSATDFPDSFYNLSYTVELFASTPDDQPEIRFQTIGLGSNVDSVDDDVQVVKSVWGQATDVVPAPTFTGELTKTGDDASDPASVICGICRKFAVTDTADIDFDGVDGRGILNSMSNTFRVGETPVPAPLALLGVGLIAIAATRRARKA